MTLDEHMARELALFIENDADLYRQQYTPQVNNLARKRYKGVYDEKLAVKLVVYLVESGLKKYRKETGYTPPVNRETKEAAAKDILVGMQDEINDQVRELAQKTRKPKRDKLEERAEAMYGPKRKPPGSLLHPIKTDEKGRPLALGPVHPKVKEVEIRRAEGPKELADMKPHIFPTMAAASAWLRSQAHTFPTTGGYDKHDLKVTWSDGETYEGRLDCKGRGLPDNDLDVKEHIVSFLSYYAKTHPGKEGNDAARFLESHMGYAE